MKLSINFNILRKVKESSAGSIVPLTSALVLFAVVVVGSGIDLGTALNTRNKIANALDASALKLAKKLSIAKLSDDEIQNCLEKMFTANLSRFDLKASALSELEFEVDWTKGILDVWSDVSVKTHFIGLGGLGPEKLDVGVTSRVSFASQALELALVLDVTGSMYGDISSLKEASQLLIETLVPENAGRRDQRTRVSIVPYSQGVNLGAQARKVTNRQSDSSNCVATRGGPKAFTDAYYNYRGARSNFFVAPGALDHFVIRRGSNVSWYPPRNNCPQSEVLPLTNSRKTLLAAVDALEAQGGTAGQAGIAWGWKALSWTWHPFWPSGSDPAKLVSSQVRKAAVIMTDGDFNVHYTERFNAGCAPVEETDGEDSTHGGKRNRRDDDDDDHEDDDDDDDKKRKRGGRCSGGTYSIEEYLPGATKRDAPATQALALCEAMKEQGVVIYTVYFETTGAKFGEDLMKSCASDPDKFYLAEDRDGLKAAFSAIAIDNLSIYLAK